jgi:hypothetical protein
MDNLSASARQARNRVELRGTTVHVDDLYVPLNEAAEYLRQIPMEKRELAFLHAVEVGVTEIMARRERFREGSLSAFGPGGPPRKQAVEARPPESLEPASPGDTSISDERRIQTRVNPRVDPAVETGAERSTEKYPEVATTPQESDGWLRRLDEDFEIMQLRACAASRTGR